MISLGTINNEVYIEMFSIGFICNVIYILSSLYQIESRENKNPTDVSQQQPVAWPQVIYVPTYSILSLVVNNA